MPATSEYVPPIVAHDSRALTRWRTALLAVAAAELVLLYTPTLAWLWTRWTMSVWHNAHGIFVLPLVAYLSWQELRDRPDLRHETGSAAGFIFLVPALLLHALDAGMHTQLLAALSLILALPGLSLLCLGVHRTKAIAFPLGFALFALPIPLALTETAHLVLRKLTVAAVSNVLPVLGVTVFTDGTTVHTGKGALGVADACSGFSTLYAAVAVATLTAYSAATAARRVLVLALAAPIAVMSNVLRVLFLVALVAGWGEAPLKTFLHPASGLMTFALSLPLIFWLGGPPRKRLEEAR